MDAIFRRCDLLTELPDVSHGFFTRRGGVSAGLHASLNAGPGSQDDPANVAENRRRIAQALRVLPDALSTLHQVHGRAVVTLDGPLLGERPQADGLVTRTPGVRLGILTADCVPVLFADPKLRVVGACHAGWKGALAGITDATIEAMEALGADRTRITAAIGPAIGWQSYEVDAGFRQRFLKADVSNESFFAPSSLKERAGERIFQPTSGKKGMHPLPGPSPEGRGEYVFNLKGYVAERLARAGIETIGVLANDTYREEDDFFSYRRSTHRQEADYGRQVSVIGLNGEGAARG